MANDKVINLKNVWHIGNRLGVGGFAQVYEASSDEGKVAVVKMIPKAPSAQRELLFESLKDTINVIPILDYGETKDAFVLVMPRAEISLRDYLVAHSNQINTNEVIQILEDIAASLNSLSATVVHRDLKPENVLKYEGKWCLADFGIARYAEATTAPDTHKYAMTLAYASPEQWRAERATHATDIYAFGIIAFELVEGVRPFKGPDFRDQHLNHPPPKMTKATPPIASLVNDCLAKAPAARPTAANVIKRLQNSQRQATPGIAALQQVNQQIAEKQAQDLAKSSAKRSVEETRAELLSAGKITLSRIIDELIERVSEAAPATKVLRQQRIQLDLGQATLSINNIQPVATDALAYGRDQPPFDVVAQTTITVRKPRDRYDYEGRTHSLWFCDAQEEGVYRWYETAFMIHPLINKRSTVNPFSLDAASQDAAICFSMVMGGHQLAWEPLAFDQGDEEQFIERWLGWFAAAAAGNLMHPNSMPERSGGSFRRAK